MAKDTKWGSDDDKIVTRTKDAALTQEQVDAGVKVALEHQANIAKPDELLRKTDAAMHGYTYPAAAEAKPA